MLARPDRDEGAVRIESPFRKLVEPDREPLSEQSVSKPSSGSWLSRTVSLWANSPCRNRLVGVWGLVVGLVVRLPGWFRLSRSLALTCWLGQRVGREADPTSVL